MPIKTKAELESEIKSLKEQLNSQSKKEEFDKCACELHEYYDSCIKAGFSEEQAWEITRTMVNNATTKRTIF